MSDQEDPEGSPVIINGEVENEADVIEDGKEEAPDNTTQDMVSAISPDVEADVKHPTPTNEHVTPVSDDNATTSKKMPSSVENKKEILGIKKDLEKRKVKSMNTIDELETERLTLQESAMMAQTEILKQQQMMVFALKEICKDKSEQVAKHYEEELSKIDKFSKELVTQNNEQEDVINYVAEAIDESKADFLEDALMAVKMKADDGLIREASPPDINYAEFKDGEMGIESLSAMIGTLNVVVMTDDGKKSLVSKFMDGATPNIQSRLLNRTRGTSIDSISTQISSGSDQNSVATQTDGSGEVGSMGISEGHFVLTANVDDIENSVDRCVESIPVSAKGLSWRIVVNKHWRDQLQIRLYYKNLEFIDKNVEYVEYGYVFKLINHKSETWTLCKKETRKIGRDAWWDSVISWSRLEDPQNGYVNNKWFTVEAKVSIEDVKFY